MTDMNSIGVTSTVGVAGAGTMGAGIAQLAATHGHPVVVYDASADSLVTARQKLDKILRRQVEKGRMSEEVVRSIRDRITWSDERESLHGAELIIEAIVEDLDAKRTLFSALDPHVADHAVFATNTSSLSVAAIGASIRSPERVVGVHFFNPAPLMPLVEIVPSMLTDTALVENVRALIDGWGKVTVIAKDTPGFIVNRIARPFYGESLRILEEGMADVATIDWAMTTLGGFPMGPFVLMDFIGNDVNFKVTQTVFEAFFYDPRYRPAFTQQRLAESGLWGKKTGRGYYDYSEGAERPRPTEDRELGQKIVDRVVAMLINEAIDAVFWQVASPNDIDLAMTKGVRYPKGLLRWANEWGLGNVLAVLEGLANEYAEDRYRPSPLLRRMVAADEVFFA